MNLTNSASQHFNENWKKYQEALENNTLYHREMMSALNEFLDKHYPSQPFSFVDLGCGDCSIIAPTLANKNLGHFIGIDAAPDVLKLAAENFKGNNCRKEFICANMSEAITSLVDPVDIIYTSYAIHHLPYQEKVDLIQSCQSQLKDNGFLLMIDGILKPAQTRDEWLKNLEDRIRTTQSISEEELELRMRHPRTDDFPEEIATFQSISHQQNWKNFAILVIIDIYAFMVFQK